MRRLLNKRNMLFFTLIAISIIIIGLFALLYSGTIEEGGQETAAVPKKANTAANPNLSKLILKVQGLICSSCVEDIKRSLRSFQEIARAKYSLTDDKIKKSYAEFITQNSLAKEELEQLVLDSNPKTASCCAK